MSALVGAVPRRSRVPMRCELQPGQLWTFTILCPFFSPLMVRQVARHVVCMRPGQHGKYMGSSTPVSVSSCPCMQMRHSSSSATCCCNTGAGTVAEACTALQDVVAGPGDPGLPSGFSGLMWPRAPGRRQHVSCLERFAPGRPFGIFITSASCSRSVGSAATCFRGRPCFLFWPSARRSSCSRLRFLSLSRRFCSPGLPSVLRGRPRPRFAIGRRTDRAAHFGTRKGGSRTLSRGGAVTYIR